MRTLIEVSRDEECADKPASVCVQYTYTSHFNRTDTAQHPILLMNLMFYDVCYRMFKKKGQNKEITQKRTNM